MNLPIFCSLAKNGKAPCVVNLNHVVAVREGHRNGNSADPYIRVWTIETPTPSEYDISMSEFFARANFAAEKVTRNVSERFANEMEEIIRQLLCPLDAFREETEGGAK